MAFHGKVPETQPRTARSNAEQKGANPAGFVEDLPFAPQMDAPLSVVGPTTYRDNADPRDAQPAVQRTPKRAPFVVTSTRK